MRLLVTANELWENVWASMGDFVSNDTVQNIWAMLDNAAVGIFIIVFFKYILPKLKENEANKALIEELTALFKTSMAAIDQNVQQYTGINLGLERKMDVMLESFNIAFTDSSIGITAKRIINKIIVGVLAGTPIDISLEMASLDKAGKDIVQDVKTKADAFIEETKISALSQLEERATKRMVN